MFLPNEVKAQQTLTQWLKHENPAQLDTIRFSKKPIQSSLKIFTGSGNVDSTSVFKWISANELVVLSWFDLSQKKVFFSYDISLNELFGDSVQVIDPQLNTRNLSNPSFLKDETVPKQQGKNDLFGNSNISKSGSLTRGITVGSNQDASLESGLRLDLSGEIADSVFLIANLTDQSTPIQPDGSTQNLREFDRVYLQVRSPNHQIEMGDIDVNFSQSEFAYINRRLQGAHYQADAFKGKYKFLASVARGIFRTQQIQVQDGFQGPYRLVGNSGEPFIVVIAGTERIFVDGKLLTRGENQDYVIDYSLGEIMFMPRILLNQRNRITVDFQYLNQDFSRTLIAAEAESDPIWDNKLSFGVSYIRETDSDNTLAQLSLGPDEIAVLEQAGDDPQKAVVSGVLPFIPIEGQNRVPYQRRDTVINGEPKTYFKVTNIISSQVFDVRFSRNNSGLGAYQRAQSGVNGVVYEFVGEGLGQYDTLRSLPRPIDQSMITLRTKINPTKELYLKTEYGISSFDRNRFSTIDDKNNADFSFLQQIQHNQKTVIAEIKSNYVFKYSGANFRYFDRPEEVDFLRKWNLNQFSITEQKVHDASTFWKFSERSNYEMQVGLINRTDMNGKRINSNLVFDETKKLGIILHNEWVNSEDESLGVNGNWLNQNLETFYNFNTDFGVLKPFAKLNYDQRKQAYSATDTLLGTSYGQYGLGLGLLYSKGKNFDSSYEFTLRDDASPLGTELVRDSRNYIHLMKINAKYKSTIQTENAFTYQQRNVTERFKTQPGFATNDAVFIKSVTRYRSLSNAVDGQFYYDVNSQRTALLQETYIEVGPELGQYVWNDLNSDGLKQIDEFFPEVTPNEGTYLKQFLPSDELLPTVNLSTRLRLAVSPVLFFDKKSNSLAKTIVNQLDWSASVDIRENSTNARLSDIYLLKLNSFLNDSTTILGRIGIRSEWTLFPRNRTHSVRFEISTLKGKNRQAFGSEDQESDAFKIELQTRINRYTSLSNELKWSEDTRDNDVLTTRNYRIKTIGYSSSVQVNQSRELQYSLDFGYSSKEELASINQVKANVIKAGANARTYLGEKIQASGRVQWRKVTVEGESSALGNFELTEGAGVGNNWIWSLQATYQNSLWVQSSLNYDGRTVPNQPVIHTIRFIIRALF